MIVYFDPQPDELPAELASPFDPGEPHPVARRAAEALMALLRDRTDLHAAGAGKMFGALVVRDGARVGYLRAFSGMLDGAWDVPGWAPPLYDAAVRDAIWPAGQHALRGLELELRALVASPAYVAASEAFAAMQVRQAAELEALRARHRQRRAERHALRAGGAVHALDQQSRGDAAERRAFDAAQLAERTAITEAWQALAARRAALERQRADESRALMLQVHDSYVIRNARGEQRPLRALFAPGEPPAGAGDCAGPKLLGAAYRLGVTPLALVELWWGAPPATGGRASGQLYPCCRGKCGPILPFMLEGLAHAAPPVFGADAIAASEPRVVFEDDHVIVVDKPAGLLSVPGRSGALTDSVLTRLRARDPAITVVHRLDLDTSGLLIAAKHAVAHVALQRAFAAREVAKRYVAVLDGDAAIAERGTITLPLRVDLEDRPRQLVDPVHGKAAETSYEVLARAPLRVALTPHTGRTHQLRVHCAVGLGAPIRGDRLYGRGGARLYLHAEHVSFRHPVTGAQLAFTSPVPF